MSFCSTYLLQGQKINRWFPSNIIYKKQQLQREQVKQNYVWSINTTKWKITDMFSFILHKVIHVPSYKHQIPYMQIPWKYSTSPVDLPRLSRFYFLAFYYSPIASGFTGLETSACPMIILSDVSHDNKLSRTKANSPYKTDPHGKGRALLSQCHGQASGKGMRSICRSLSGPVSRPATALEALTKTSSRRLSSHRNACHSRAHTVKSRSAGRGGDCQPHSSCWAASPERPHLLSWYWACSCLQTWDTEERELTQEPPKELTHLIAQKTSGLCAAG